MKNNKTIDELMKDQEEDQNEEIKVRLQLLENGEVVEEKEGNAFIGVLLSDCDCGKCNGSSYNFLLKGMASSHDLIISKYAINKNLEKAIEGPHTLSKLLGSL